MTAERFSTQSPSSLGHVGERCAPKRAEPVSVDLTQVPAIVESVDPSTRVELMARLQRSVGNAAVQRLMASRVPLRPVQRWAVGLARGQSDAGAVVRYINANSPHPNKAWALTKVAFTANKDLAVSGTAPDFTVAPTNPAVSYTKTVDMPTWSPSDPGMAASWASMSADLRAHEAEHEAIGDTSQASMLTNLQGWSHSATAKPSAAAKSEAKAQLDADWAGWLADHQTDQNAIDPYYAMLDQPAPAQSESAESAPESEAEPGDGPMPSAGPVAGSAGECFPADPRA